MKIRFKLVKLGHFCSIIRKRIFRGNLAPTGEVVRTLSPEGSTEPLDPKCQPEVDAQVIDLAEENHALDLLTPEKITAPGFQLFVNLPTEIRFKIWREIAQSTTQVIHIIPYTTGSPGRNFKFHGCYRSLTPFPAFLQVDRETREEGMRHYEFLEGGREFKRLIPFNYNRDIVFVSLQLAHSRWLLQSLRSMLQLKSWIKIQNVAYQVQNWNHYPKHLDLLQELPSLKEVYFTSDRAKQFRSNIDKILSGTIVYWGFRNCAGILGRDTLGQVDFDGVDEIDEVSQRPFQFFPLKMEFEYARLYNQPTLAIHLPNWCPRFPVNDANNIIWNSADEHPESLFGEDSLMDDDEDLEVL